LRSAANIFGDRRAKARAEADGGTRGIKMDAEEIRKIAARFQVAKEGVEMTVGEIREIAGRVRVEWECELGKFLGPGQNLEKLADIVIGIDAMADEICWAIVNQKWEDLEKKGT
jgi:hypothetical protein